MTSAKTLRKDHLIQIKIVSASLKTRDFATNIYEVN